MGHAHEKMTVKIFTQGRKDVEKGLWKVGVRKYQKQAGHAHTSTLGSRIERVGIEGKHNLTNHCPRREEGSINKQRIRVVIGKTCAGGSGQT